MATSPVKKTTAAVKPKAVPTKAIATAASKVRVKAPLKAHKSASPMKAAIKPAIKPAVKPAVKPAIKPKANPVVVSPNKPAAKKQMKAVVTPAIISAITPIAEIAPVKEKAKKAKLVRDSFTMPETEYAVLSYVKKACLSAGIEAKKSQLLRVGLVLLSKTDISTLKALIANLEPLKAGRPKKDK